MVDMALILNRNLIQRVADLQEIHREVIALRWGRLCLGYLMRREMVMLDAADDVEMEIVDQPAEDPVRLDEANLEAEFEQIEIPELPSREARRRPAELTVENAQSSNAMATTPPRNNRGTASTTTASAATATSTDT